jgi:type IV secretory pathway TraG/TraD family ATPase VirD4
MAPPLAGLLLGAGIRRSGEKPGQRSWSQRLALFAAFCLPSVSLIGLYTRLFQGYALARLQGKSNASSLIRLLAGGPPNLNPARLLIAGLVLLALLGLLNLGLYQGLREGGWLREWLDRQRRPTTRRGEMGSAHFCTFREYRRYRRPDSEGVTLLGAFWSNRRRLDVGRGQFCLSGEDIARGILALGSAGSGKTQGIILPVIADRMAAGHSLIIADPQGEITPHVLRVARVTRHLVIVHDPTSATGPRYNLAADIHSVSDARAIADVLVPSAHGDNRFWTDSAASLLAACLIHFDTLGEIYQALSDLKRLAETLAKDKGDAALLANSFIASVGADGKVASNVVATLATALTGWAATDVRANTGASDFNAALIIAQPTVVVLTCPGRMRAVYASYLGATLRKLMLDLDTLGEQNRGPLPVPVGIILDEFPTLGKLDSLISDVNLVRKRRLSILIAAQTKGQFHLLYGPEGTQALFTGLATQIVYGGCDHDTAEFYSKASGTATSDANPDPQRASMRQRPLLTVDEVVTPQAGNCTIFARYVEPAFATQVILTARLTRFYERKDWAARLKANRESDVFLLERGPVTSQPVSTPDNQSAAFEQTAAAHMAAAREALTAQGKPGVQFSTLGEVSAMIREAQAANNRGIES